jgi:hypothetical protein
MLRNADPLLWTGSLFVVTGVEEVADQELGNWCPSHWRS